MVANIYRQGDVLLMRVDKKPSKAATVKRMGGKLVLAEGEVTGHAHTIEGKGARLFAVNNDHRFLVVTGTDITLAHEEHAAIPLEPGIFRVIRQREYMPSDRPVLEKQHKAKILEAARRARRVRD
jgi:hypothetical protein